MYSTRDIFEKMCFKLFTSWRSLSSRVDFCAGFFQNSHVRLKEDGVLTPEDFKEMVEQFEDEILKIRIELDKLKELSNKYIDSLQKHQISND